MLRSIRLKFGPPGAEPLAIPLGRITVVVGPNQSGKSLLLDEVERGLERKAAESLIVDAIEPTVDGDSDTAAMLRALVARALEHLHDVATDRASVELDYAYIGSMFGLGSIIDIASMSFHDLASAAPTLFRSLGHRRRREHSTDLLKRVEKTQNQVRIVAAYHRDRLTAWREREDWAVAADEAIAEGVIDVTAMARHLTGMALRISGAEAGRQVAEPSVSEALGRETDRVLSILLDEEWRRAILEPFIGETFSLYPVIDPTEMQTLTLRLAEKPPGLFAQALTPAARAYLAASRPLSDFSAGVQSFVGLLALTIARPRPLLLIDEPETFLHPPLARRLGYFMALLAEQSGLQLVVATHSVDFLMGVAEVHPPTVVRLSHDGRRSAAWAMPGPEFKAHLSNPQLRSSGILRALFAQGAIICEGHSDQAVYEEIHRRSMVEGGYYRDVVFFGANGKQNIPRLLAVLRALGVPSAGILDWDVLHDPVVRKRLWSAVGAAEAGTELRRLFDKVSAASHAGSETSKAKGLDALAPDLRAEAESVLQHLAEHGAFLVPNGELESWLSELGIGERKRKWAERALGKLESDVTTQIAAPHLAHFIARVESWLGNQSSYDLAQPIENREVGEDGVPEHLRPLLTPHSAGHYSAVDFFGLQHMEMAHNNAVHHLLADEVWRAALMPALIEAAGWTDLLDEGYTFDEPPERQYRLPGGDAADEYIVARRGGVAVPILIELKVLGLGGVRQLSRYLAAHGTSDGVPRGLLLRLSLTPDPFPHPHIAQIKLGEFINCLDTALAACHEEEPGQLPRRVVAEYRQTCARLHEQEALVIQHTADVMALSETHQAWWKERGQWVRNVVAGCAMLVFQSLVEEQGGAESPPPGLGWLGPKVRVNPSNGENTYLDFGAGFGDEHNGEWIERDGNGRALAAPFLKLRIWDRRLTLEVHAIIASYEQDGIRPPDEMAAMERIRSRLREAHARLPLYWKKHTPQSRHRSGMILSVEHTGSPRDLDALLDWFGHRVAELWPALGLTWESTKDVDDQGGETGGPVQQR